MGISGFGELLFENRRVVVAVPLSPAHGGSLRRGEDHQEFTRLLEQAIERRSADQTALFDRLQPDDRLVRLLDDDAVLGDELAATPGPTGGMVVGGDRRAGVKELIGEAVGIPIVPRA